MSSVDKALKKTVNRYMIKKISALILAISLFTLPARAEPMQEFLMSCAYGTLAGALVGVATLAFTEDPSSNLNNIARGASLGLYAGIGLGLYLSQRTPEISGSELKPSFAVVPIWHINEQKQKQIDGMQMSYSLLQF